jgi:hypothetical protein
MNIEIGTRTIESMTSEEFGNFIYNHGYCVSDQYWHKPVFSEFEYDRPTNSIHFAFTQEGKVGQGIKSFNGIIPKFDEYSHFSYLHDNHGEYSNYILNVRDIAYFIKLGFYFPLLVLSENA